jgi:hypothetical protein
LLGVATPADLIQDSRTTPFNIGKRIELTDFTEEEAVPLARGLGKEPDLALKLLNRVLYWTGGHPYLSQQLCQAVAENVNVTITGDVDRLCEEMFLSSRSRDRDNNIHFVRKRLLSNGEKVFDLLNLYAKVYRQEKVPADEANPLVKILLLSGVVKPVEGYLSVRNRIYQAVFDQEWMERNMLGDERKHLHVASGKVFRSIFIYAIILTSIAALFYIGLKNKPEQRSVLAETEQTRQIANAKSADMLSVNNAKVASEDLAYRNSQPDLKYIAPEVLKNPADPMTWQLLADLMTWRSLKEDPNPLAFEAYLEVYPEGEFAEPAKVRIKTAKTSPGTYASGVITGRVYDLAINEPILAATVMARNQENGLEQAAITNLEGRFIMMIPPGLYTIIIHHPGYERKSVSDLAVVTERINRTDQLLGGLQIKP